MSWAATAWAQQQRTGSPTGKVVLLLLADRAGEDGVCWPSLGLLAEEAECSADTVRRTIRHLQALGLLSITTRHRANGAQSSNGYRLHMGVVHSPPSQSARGGGSNLPGGGVANCQGVGVANCHPYEPPEGTSPPTPHAPVASDDRPTGGGEEDQEKRKQAQAALRAAGLNARAADELAPRAVEAIDQGWAPEALSAHLSADLPSVVRSLPALVAKRLEGLPEAPSRPSSRPSPARTAIEACPLCDEHGMREVGTPGGGHLTLTRCQHRP